LGSTDARCELDRFAEAGAEILCPIGRRVAPTDGMYSSAARSVSIALNRTRSASIGDESIGSACGDGCGSAIAKRNVHPRSGGCREVLSDIEASA
jgi:hypothetical protein